MGALGPSDKQIATELGLSLNSVKLYLAKVRVKLGPFERAVLPGIGLLLNLVSVADITREGLVLLQERIPGIPGRRFHGSSS